MLADFFGVEKGLYQSSVKEKENFTFAFPYSTKREIRHFHVLVVQRRKRNVQKSVMHAQCYYFANLKLLVERFAQGSSGYQKKRYHFVVENQIHFYP